MTKKEQKAAEKAAYVQRVRAALKAAHDACHSAGVACIDGLPKDAQGLPSDGCGDAWVQVYTPSYQFRTTLQELGELERGHAGAWIISNFTRSLGTQSFQANKAGAQAAYEVLRAQFPEEANIYPHAYET